MLQVETECLRSTSIHGTYDIRLAGLGLLISTVIATFFCLAVRLNPVDELFMKGLVCLLPAGALILLTAKVLKWRRLRARGVVILADVGDNAWMPNGFRSYRIKYDWEGTRYLTHQKMHGTTQGPYVGTQLHVVIDPRRPRKFYPLYLLARNSKETKELLASNTTTWTRNR